MSYTIPHVHVCLTLVYHPTPNLPPCQLAPSCLLPPPSSLLPPPSCICSHVCLALDSCVYFCVWVCSVFFVFFTVIVMSVINISLFDMHLYYGAGAKSLGSAMVLLTVLLTIVAMGVVDVCHIYLVRPPLPSLVCCKHVYTYDRAGQDGCCVHGCCINGCYMHGIGRMRLSGCLRIRRVTVQGCFLSQHRMLFPSPTYVIQEQERGHGAKGYGLVAAENGALTPSIGASSGTGAETRAFLDVSDPPPSHHA